MIPLDVLGIAIFITVAAQVPPVHATILIVLEYAVMIVIFLMFAPISQVNPYIQAVIERTLGPTKPRSVAYDCQIALTPRLSRGLRRVLDDSDDVGRLEITNEVITFHGGSVTLALPFRDIESATRMRPKARNLWITGGAMRLVTTVFDGIKCIDFFERQSRTSWNSRRVSAEIAYAIEYGMQGERAKVETDLVKRSEP